VLTLRCIYIYIYIYTRGHWALRAPDSYVLISGFWFHLASPCPDCDVRVPVAGTIRLVVAGTRMLVAALDSPPSYRTDGEGKFNKLDSVMLRGFRVRSFLDFDHLV
jgi:hypothetical protein